MAGDRDKVESHNLEETREIGTGIKGSRNVYTGGNREESELIVDNTEQGAKDREKARKEREEGKLPKEGTWDNAKRFLDPDSK